MKANELRLNNLVLVNGITYKVLSIEQDGVLVEPLKDSNNMCYDFENYKLEPIPLTEEWLLQFGLVRNEVDRKRFYICGVDLYVFNSEKIIFNPSSASLSLYIKHVHTLQNLYFALTGEELKIKDDENN